MAIDVESSMGLNDLVPAGLSYLNRRFPLQSLGVALAVTFLSAYLIYGRASGHLVLGIGTILGAATFVLLFLQLRIVDDLDDVDSARGPDDSERQIRLRKLQLTSGLIATTCLIAALNWGSSALAVALSATALMIINPFVLKNGVKKYITKPSDADQLTTGSLGMDLLLAIFYEGVPVLMVLYIYYKWSALTQTSSPRILILSVTCTFWALYEIWKYSRFLTRPDWHPYGLHWTGAKVLIVCLFLVAAATQVMTALLSGLSMMYSTYVLVLTSLFIVFVWQTAPSAARDKRAKLRALAGLAYVGAVDLGILVAVFAGQ